MIKIPYGKSDYKTFVEEEYFYQDRTSYIQTLENWDDTYLVYLRPRRFGKSLFISTLHYYYGVELTIRAHSRILWQNLNSKKMKKYILFGLLCTAFHIASAQVETLKGKLIKKPWTKSMQSYCAGGSDYYVLVGKDKKESVLNLSTWNEAQIAKKLNKQVRLKGKWETVQKENNDPMSQQPVDAPLCRTFVVMP